MVSDRLEITLQVKIYHRPRAEQVQIQESEGAGRIFSGLRRYLAALGASDGPDRADCFRITNSCYEYVKWLNRENEVQTQREGARETKTSIGLQLNQAIINSTTVLSETFQSDKVFMVIFEYFHFLTLLLRRLR